MPYFILSQMGLVGQLASLRIERGSGYTQEQLEDRNRQVEWERGQIDYMGIDSFSNIQVSPLGSQIQKYYVVKVTV